MPQALEIPPGTTFGRLTVLEDARTPSGRRAMLCQCECGQRKTVDLAHLRDGHTTSCGCFRREVTAENARTNPLLAAYRASDLRRQQSHEINVRHGLSGSLQYHRWHSMIARCENPRSASFKHYGARGIKVCPEWHDVAVFIAWIDENLGACPEGMSFDRINNDGDYEPGNVRWATPLEQSANSRQPKLTLKDRIEIQRLYAVGDTTQDEIALDYGVSRPTITNIINGKYRR